MIYQTNMKIQISEVKIEFIKPCDGIVAFASVVINDAICLSSIAIYKKLSAEGYRITYPSKGKFNIFHPISREAGYAIETAVLEKFQEVMSKVVYET
jgi:DNA-binding cell septation regulator SpoVG